MVRQKWIGKKFNVIDSRVVFVGAQQCDVFEREIRKQVHIAVDEANAIVFYVRCNNRHVTRS